MQMRFKSYHHFVVEEGGETLFDVTYDFDKRHLDLTCQVVSGMDRRTILFKRTNGRILTTSAKYRIDENGSPIGTVIFKRGSAMLEIAGQPNMPMQAGKTYVHDHVYVGGDDKNPMMLVYKLASPMNSSGTHEIEVKKLNVGQNYALLAVYGGLLNYLSDSL